MNLLKELLFRRCLYWETRALSWLSVSTIFPLAFISDNKQSWSAISPWNRNNKAISTWFIGSVDGYWIYLELLLSADGGSGPVLEGQGAKTQDLQR